MTAGKIKKLSYLNFIFLILYHVKLMGADSNSQPWILGDNPPKLSLEKVVRRDNGELLSRGSIKRGNGKVTLQIGINQIKSLTFICEHSQPIQWSFECPFLDYDYFVTITKTIAKQKESEYLFSSTLEFGSKWTMQIPNNFTCHESESLQSGKRVSSAFFHDLELSDQAAKTFWFYFKNKFVSSKCSSKEETLISKCPVYINLDIETRTYECSNSYSKFKAQFYDCSSSLDFCLSSMAQDGSNGTCLRQTNEKPYKLKLETSGIINCQPDNPTLPSVNALIFSLPQRHSGGPRIYTSVEEVRSDPNILVISPVLESKVKFYNGERVELQCSGFKPILANGFRWFTKYNNGSEILYETTANSVNQPKPKKDMILERKVFSIETNISEIRCEGLTPNLVRAGWAKAAFKLERVLGPTHPQITSFTVSEFGPGLRFNCKMIGQPHPTILINLCNITCPDVEKNLVNRNRDFGQVEVPKTAVIGMTHAVCVGGNFLGNVTEVIQLPQNIFQPPGMQKTVSIGYTWIFITIGVAVFICIGSLGIVIGTLYVKLNRKRSKIQLIESELQMFFNGVKHPEKTEDPLQYPFSAEYNTKFEIAPGSVQLQDGIIASGQFGVVLKGLYNGNTVAVKSLRDSPDIIYLKALLAEIKILIFLGEHKHIVNIIGACTENLRNLKLMLVLDFCENGSLLSFLRSSRPFFVDLLTKKELENHDSMKYENVLKLTTDDLIRFSCEVADAMLFIAEKMIMHGDIAARNVLVTGDMSIKLCDFGLAKQLSDYQIYVQKKQIPMPVKWMAYESLRDLKFSIESDAWSFGILMWEIFSLAEVPYAGLHWEFGSWRMLQNGYRMERPQHSNDSIYQLMKKCWTLDPKERPKFKEILPVLQGERSFLSNSCGTIQFQEYLELSD